MASHTPFRLLEGIISNDSSVTENIKNLIYEFLVPGSFIKYDKKNFGSVSTSTKVLEVGRAATEAGILALTALYIITEYI